jgi:hypothetical protein
VLIQVAAGSLTALLTGVVLLRLSPYLVEQFAQPSCDKPTGLTLLEPAGIDVRASSTADPASYEFARNEPADFWAAAKLLDGNTGSVWAPAADQTIGAVLEFTFTEQTDIQLICVVNGVPANTATYDRAGKLRAAQVGTDVTADADDPVSPLIVQSFQNMQNRQPLEFESGPTNSVTLTVRSVYSGIDAVDATGTRVVTEASPLTAVAEVEFYVES